MADTPPNMEQSEEMPSERRLTQDGRPTWPLPKPPQEPKESAEPEPVKPSNSTKK